MRAAERTVRGVVSLTVFAALWLIGFCLIIGIPLLILDRVFNSGW